MELTDYRDYRAFLRDQMEKRLQANPRYSLRAFARDLRMTPQALSGVLRSKKGISLDTAASIANHLELSPRDACFLADLVTLAHSRSPQARKIASFKIHSRDALAVYRSLEAEVFAVISDWYHAAILELVQSVGFKNDSKWIAGRLGISVHEATQAIVRLRKLELINEDSDGNLFRTNANLSASYGVPSTALRKLSRQLLHKGVESLDQQSMSERKISNMTMAIDPIRLEAAEKMIIRFGRRLAAFLEQGNRTEVYAFVPALFRISKPETSKKREGRHE